MVRAVRTITMILKLDADSTPKTIDLATQFDPNVILIKPIVVEKVKVSPNSTTNTVTDSKVTFTQIDAPPVNKGIYNLQGDLLTYCLAAPGKPRPKRFAAPKNSGQTLVWLRRFKTGEAETIATLKKLGATVSLNEDGWAIHVGLARSKISDNDLALLKGLSRLETLYHNSTQTTDVGLAHLSHLKNLIRLNLISTKVTDEGLRHLKGLGKLRSLWLAKTSISDAGMAHLAGLDNLNGLWLADTSVSDKGLSYLAHSTNLNTLVLTNTKVGDAGLANLSGLTKLQYLRLGRTRVSDEGLGLLQGLSLKTLELDGTRVTDTGLAQLTAMKSLKHISVTNTDVTASRINKIRAVLPELKIDR